jgi:hypothetical protein
MPENSISETGDTPIPDYGAMNDQALMSAASNALCALAAVTNINDDGMQLLACLTRELTRRAEPVSA